MRPRRTPIKPYSESSERNRDPILRIIRPLLRHCHHVLEIGSGTGQHAVYFAERIPNIVWHTSDLPTNQDGIRCWIDESRLANVNPPICLDMSISTWTEELRDTHIDAIYSANTAHIMSEQKALNMIAGAGDVLQPGGLFILYGPFNYKGSFTSPSNQKFDVWLKQRSSEQGIRDFERLHETAESAKLILQQDYAMPANNRLICWRKT